MKNLITSGIILILICSGCKKESSTCIREPLLKTGWVLLSVQDTGTNAITNFPDDAARKISIVFTDSSNVILFTGICNTGAGTFTYSSETGEIEVTDLSSTKIGCQYVEWEEYTIQNLTNAYSYNLSGDHLVIYSHGLYDLYFAKDQLNTIL